MKMICTKHKSHISILCLRQRGQELGQVTSEGDKEAATRISVLLDYLNERQVDLDNLAKQKQLRLQQCVHLRNFEIEARQVGASVILHY